ncbi:hypothetical protein MLD38_019665 [Melastoma candidum]|uniref:Uncharacterized protein n=1 Tax=Melastoma candidum TaxID=119954 RepID=A0ACB9QZL3_9MYRT|nr:hypothetical protein MLD38_019665 [Melastoma candidum]
MRGPRTNSVNRFDVTSYNVSDAMHKSESPMARIAKIEALVCLTISLSIMLTVFGTQRRRSRSGVLRGLLWIVYTASSLLIVYILGLMQETPFRDELFSIWGMLLLIAYAFPDSFSAYSLDDIEQWMQYYFQFAWKFMVLLFLWTWSPDFEGGFKPENMLAFCLVWTVLVKFLMRTLSLGWASRSSLEENIKPFQVYLSNEHKWSEEDAVDPASMRGYNFLVAVLGSPEITLDKVERLKNCDPREFRDIDDVVTLEKVWDCKGRLLGSSRDPDGQLKDICLSFSLFRILLLKYANYKLPTEALGKVHRLIRDVLLSDQGGHERAFRVVESELKFLYEFFYTKYPLYMSKLSQIRAFQLLLFVGALCLCPLYISKHSASLEKLQLATVLGTSLDVLVTYILLGILLMAEVMQLWMIGSSEWAKVTYICNYVVTSSWQKSERTEKFVEWICKTQFSKPWDRKLGQYSLIESHGYDFPSRRLRLRNLIRGRSKEGQTESKAIHLSEEVKEAVFSSLRTEGETLEDGRSSLRRIGAYSRLSWTFKEHEHQAEVILIWHIATSYCQYRGPASGRRGKNFRVVMDLSNYLAYLVAFAPRLLPGHPYDPVFHFRGVVKEAWEVFDGCKTAELRINKLKALAGKEEEDRMVIATGAKLGEELLQLGEEGSHDIWEILAGFWSEMMLCAATSGSERAHAEKLASGGEFVTHLWALLHHGEFTLAPRGRP